MSMDLTKLFIPMVGVFYDFVFSRPWKQIGLFALPAILATALALFCTAGGGRTQKDLTRWYAGLAQKEVAAWEDRWIGENELKEAAADTEEAAPARITAYADMLFRRVEQLAPNDRSRFFIAASLAQRGADAEANEILDELAPDDGEGLPMAHSFVALRMIQDSTQQELRENLPLILHHLEQARKQDRLPLELLKAGSDLYWAAANIRIDPESQLGYRQASLKLLTSAASSDPTLNLELARRARILGNRVVGNSAVSNATAVFEKMLSENPQDMLARLNLAECKSMADKIEEAEKLLLDAPERTDAISRGLSELYRYRFLQSMTTPDMIMDVNIQLLDRAYSYDPTNPKIGEEIAKLIRFSGPQVSDEMFDKLRDLVNRGTATGITHRWLAEAYLVQRQLQLALPHLKQVVTKLPLDHQSLNNLAYVTSALDPEKNDEAIKLCERAIQIAVGAKTPNGDYFDTYGTLLMKGNDVERAITAYETAIQLLPMRVDFRRRVANAYRKLGDEKMAESQEKFITQIEAKLAAQEAEARERARLAAEEKAKAEAEAAAPKAKLEAEAKSNAESSASSEEKSGDDSESPETEKSSGGEVEINSGDEPSSQPEGDTGPISQDPAEI
ncbi:MAG: tetratricopeptide repeat protein [Planctomycetota bacterium]|nr:tetratricopeptide repeat protein [Planctomycetota bacterium]